MLFTRIFVINCCVLLCLSQATEVLEQNVSLSRRKRYLSFPMGSNLVITLSLIKPFADFHIKGHNMLFEADVPFTLPSDTRLFQNRRRNHYMQRREVYSQLEMALTQNGLNGTACVTRLICEAKEMISEKGKSLVKDLLFAIFLESEDVFQYSNICDNSVFEECQISFLNYILKSLTFS